MAYESYNGSRSKPQRGHTKATTVAHQQWHIKATPVAHEVTMVAHQATMVAH